MMGGITSVVGLLHIKPLHDLMNAVPRYAWVAIIILTAFALTLLMQKLVVALACSLSGSLSTVCGLDIFMRTGLDEQVIAILTKHHEKLQFTINSKMVPLVIIFFSLAVVGLACQWRLRRSYHYTQIKSKARPESPRGICIAA